jgi:DNA adenine methylase
MQVSSSNGEGETELLPERGRPLLRWAGSKRKLLPELSRYWSIDHARYVEPFAGSACLFFWLAPQDAILGDVNSALIEMYAQVQQNVSAVATAIASLKSGKRHYLQVRSLDPASLQPHERAARFIYLNRHCFNGIYRTNRRGKFNVPYGAHKAGKIPNLEAFQHSQRVLANAQFVAGDFSTALERVRPGDFVYLDPPFSVSTRRIFREYDPASFARADLGRLREWLLHLNRIGATFLLSYADSPEARSLGKGYVVRTVTVQRNIAGFSKHRRTARELLISNSNPSRVID